MSSNVRLKRVAGFATLSLLFLGTADDASCAPVVRAPAAKKPAATAAAKKTGFNPAIFQTPDAKDFLDKVKKHIERNWFPAKADAAEVTVRFRIHRDGKVSWVESPDRSDIEAVNQAAEDTVYYGGKFPSIPMSMPDYVDVEAEFLSDYQPPTESGYSRPAAAKLAETTKLLEEAAKDKSGGNYDGAIDKLQKAFSLTPHDGRVKDALVKAYAHVAKEKPADEAIKIYHKLLLVDPLRDKSREKLNELLRAADKDPKDFKVRLNFARDAALNSEYDDSISEYGEAWKLDKAHFPAIEVNAVCKLKTKSRDLTKWEAAAKTYNTPETRGMYQQALARIEPLKLALTNYINAQRKQEEDESAKVDPAVEVELCAEIAGTRDRGERGQSLRRDALTLVSDEFPYNDFGSLTLKVKALPDRKAQVSYLRHACPTQTIRWASNRIPLKLYVEESYHAPGYRPQFKGFVVRALETWNNAAGGRLPFELVTDPFEANIEVRFTANPSSAKMMRGNEQGVTHFMYYLSETNNCIVKSAKIYILTLDRIHLAPATDQLMESVCLHEIGHALGIAGHSPFYGDIMFPVLFADYFIPRQLTDRDGATIKNLYQNYNRHIKK